ncbi:RNA 2',3'-cyclic phosphodiesterase [Nitratifractor sp.]
MRLFIASSANIEDYSAIRSDFSEVLYGKWVEEENLHLTWSFLGEQKSTDPWLERLKPIPSMSESTELRSIGFFGHPPRILYARCESDVLMQKVKEFERQGFSMKRFRPHVTLCRIKRIEDWKGFKELVKKYRGENIGEVLPEIALYESKLTRAGPIYTKIENVTT